LGFWAEVKDEMETARVDIVYRPLRVAWVIHSEDKESFRRAVRLNHAFWGGFFNPIVFSDRPEEAENIVRVFRADLIWPLGEDPTTQKFAEGFSNLIDPLRGNPFPGAPNRAGSALLDIQNALTHLRATEDFAAIRSAGVRIYTWDNEDPLADVHLMQFGAYPSPAEIGIDYKTLLEDVAPISEIHLSRDAVIPEDVLNHPSIAYFSKHQLQRHYTIQPISDEPGFFLGNSSNLLDLALFWNLRAAHIRLWFVDPAHMSRTETICRSFQELLFADPLRAGDEKNRSHLWYRPETIDQPSTLFPDQPLAIHEIGDFAWNGLNIKAPMMTFGSESALGVLGKEDKKPRISFALGNKPFSDEGWFHSQHLVASLSIIGGLLGDEHYTLQPPYIPEMNEQFSRAMLFDYSKFRAEPERLGIIINATEHSILLDAMPVSQLFENVFDLANLAISLSSGGLLTRQLLAKMGGVRHTRVFKVPGVRRLLKTYGPAEAFTAATAYQLIATKDPKRPDASFDDHKRLYIEPRRSGDLTKEMVFSHLVEKGLFRIGFELECPLCRLSSWTAIDNIRQNLTCELCGQDFDATRLLMTAKQHYRRTGVLGREKNTQGAIPVTLVLEQVTRAFDGHHGGAYYFPSFDVRPKTGNGDFWEIDFAVLCADYRDGKVDLMIGECKDEGQIDANDIENLRLTADAFPAERFNVFIALAKISPFTENEIALAKQLNNEYRRRAILMTARDLEPYELYANAKDPGGHNFFVTSMIDAANYTHQTYFSGGT
jgi:hypothetical protein